jgi:hypothetical protein
MITTCSNNRVLICQINHRSRDYSASSAQPTDMPVKRSADIKKSEGVKM